MSALPVLAKPRDECEWDGFPFEQQRAWWAASIPSLLHGSQAVLAAAKPYPESEFPEGAGVYFLIWKGLIVYAGMSKQIATRLLQHADEGRPFEAVATLSYIPWWALELVEHVYVKAWDLPWNSKRTWFRGYRWMESAADLVETVSQDKTAIMPWFVPSLPHAAFPKWQQHVIGYRQAHPAPNPTG